MSRISSALVAALVALLVGGGRHWYETRVLMPLVPADPQNAIWYVMSLVTSVVAALLSFALCWAGLHRIAAAAGRLGFASGIALLAGLAVVVAWTARDLHRMSVVRQALIDAADPGTTVERLRELATHPGGPGYEIDNRVAGNPNTPPDVLRMLHGRPDQVGTEMCLAANPNTPDDILRELAGRGDEWGKIIRAHLRRNPRHADLFGPDAAAREDRGPGGM
jgi:hypothetical protein